MQKKHLQIIVMILISVGTIQTGLTVYKSYELSQDETYQNEVHPYDMEDFLIVLIGAVISVSWYFPFFITAYWLYAKKIKANPAK